MTDDNNEQTKTVTLCFAFSRRAHQHHTEVTSHDTIWVGIELGIEDLFRDTIVMGWEVGMSFTFKVVFL
jgi:hypothetical protein